MTAQVMQVQTLEQEVEILARRWSKTAQERVQIVRELAPMLKRYRYQGGKHVTAWLKGRGFSHGTAINIIGAAAALDAGLVSDSVSELADMGHLLKRGKTADEVVELQAQRATHRALTEEAGIGLGSVRYPTDSALEMAGIYTELAQSYKRSNLTVPEIPEMTLTLARIASRHMGDLLVLEGSTPAPTDKPAPAVLDPYAWIAAQPGTCDVKNCNTPWEHLHHIALTDHPRRNHPAARLTVLRLCQRHHLTGDAAAVHGTQGEAAFYEREFGGRDHALEIVLFRAAEYAEYLNTAAEATRPAQESA